MSGGRRYSAARSEAKTAWILAAAWMAVIVGLSVASVSGVPRLDVPFGLDRWAHAGFYAVLGVLIARALRLGGAGLAAALSGSFVWAVAFGGLVEWIQTFRPRQASLGDWVADALGAALGLAIWAVVSGRGSERTISS